MHRYLLNFSEGEFVCECLRVCDARGILCEDVFKKNKGSALGALMGCGFIRNSWKPFDSFH